MGDLDPVELHPERADSTAEFVDLLGRLRHRSGRTYRELERRAAERGDLLPRSTIADVLRRSALPREDLLAAFIRACGAEDELKRWMAARDRLADAQGEGGEGADAQAASHRIGEDANVAAEPNADDTSAHAVRGRRDGRPPEPAAPTAAAPPRAGFGAAFGAVLLVGLVLILLVTRGDSPPSVVSGPVDDAAVGPGSTHCTSTNPWGSLCIRVTRAANTASQIEGSVETTTPHCSMALMVSGTSPDGRWYGSAKRTPCGVVANGVYVHTYVWKHDSGLVLKPGTRLCVQAGVFTGNEPNPTDWSRSKACVWISG
ncbi:hypothetical protein F4553_000372 [Allocatelliglobosispora scoriae]|uniref:XRE family transcriptional regulator n=1 Tax=Allocatelliglobosispora scoriae TaxID=643052 RepID=A0A841BIV9_9ACTN|nr:helix-turn-helix transcriptional regulator [Allocatelliglobosispora scoriae]MBB5866993.1 hypothetical protein [Allocatelliglobosispora scoriae]